MPTPNQSLVLGGHGTGTVRSGQQDITTIWTAAFERCKSQLTPKELERVVQVRTHGELIDSIKALKKQYQLKKTASALTLIDPFLQNLLSFTGVIDTAIQSNPEIASLCWGGIKLVLEVNMQRA